MLKLKYSAIAVFISFLSLGQQPMINEAVNNPFTVFLDIDGESPTWIELYNPTSTTIELKNYYLSPAANNLHLYKIHDELLHPYGFALIALSGKNRVDWNCIHANFEWTNNQNRMYLSDSLGNVIDFIEVPDLPYDRSYGRITDGDSLWQAFAVPSPGASNAGHPIFHPQNEALTIWPLSGWYDVDSILVEMQCTQPNAEICYTLDGSTPDTTSLKYNGSFWLRANPVDTFYFAGINTNPESSSGSWKWRPPLSMPYKNNIITACAFENGKQISPVYHRHLFLKRGKHELDVGVMSISTAPSNLFDHEKGIYVPGKTHEDNPEISWVWGTGNYHNRGRQWERESNIAFFEADGSLAWQQNVGIRIHGGGSRALPMKSLRLYARSIYGESKINYPFFPGRNFAEYNRILLRNSGQDFIRTMFTDAMVHEIALPLGIESQMSRPIVHFINGEYWGVINIRDRLDESYIAYTKGLDEENVKVLDLSSQQPNGGDLRMKAFIDFLENTDNMNAQGVYDTLGEYIDIANYLDYYIVRIFLGVYDWPGNNRSVWRPLHSGGKFRNILFDSDGALERYKYNNLQHALEENGGIWPNPPWSTLVLRKLLENETIKNDFIRRNEELAATIFHPNRLVSILDSFKTIYQPLMEGQYQRWQFPGKDASTWRYFLSFYNDFIDKRHCHMRSFFMDHFDLPETYMMGFGCREEKKPKKHLADFKQFPNPTTGDFTIGFKVDSVQNIQISIADLVGKTIYEDELYLSDVYHVETLEVLRYKSPGLYILSVESNKGVDIVKIFKQ